MKKIIILLSLFAKIVFAFNIIYGGVKNPQKPVFCGRDGHIYDITEPDMWQEIVQKAKDVNETFFANLMKKEFNKAFIADNQLPYCKKFKIVKYVPIYTLQRDLYVNGRLLYKKGYNFNILTRLNETMKPLKPLLYFGDLDNNVSKYIGLHLIKKYKHAIFAVLKGNVKQLAYKNPYKIAKASNLLLNKFKINCNSTIAILGNKYIYLIEIPINNFKREDIDKLFNIVNKKYKDFYYEN